MEIEIENGVTWDYGDGVPEAFITIVNMLSWAKSPEDFRNNLELLDRTDHLGVYFKWGFGAHHFWLKQRYTFGSEEVKKERVLISRF